MPNQIPRRQILENPTQVQNANMRQNPSTPFDMPGYNIPTPTQRPIQVQNQNSTPQRPSAADIPQARPTQVEPTPQAAPDIDFSGAQIGVPVFNPEFTQGYLRQNIGERVKIEFLIGTNMFIDRQGILVDVGITYVIIQETDTDDLLLCDIYSIKFVSFFR